MGLAKAMELGSVKVPAAMMVGGGAAMTIMAASTGLGVASQTGSPTNAGLGFAGSAMAGVAGAAAGGTAGGIIGGLYGIGRARSGQGSFMRATKWGAVGAALAGSLASSSLVGNAIASNVHAPRRLARPGPPMNGRMPGMDL